jgi:hypothetical protein
MPESTLSSSQGLWIWSHLALHLNRRMFKNETTNRKRDSKRKWEKRGISRYFCLRIGILYVDHGQSPEVTVTPLHSWLYLPLPTRNLGSGVDPYLESNPKSEIVFLEGPEDDVRNEGDNDEEEGEEPDPGGGEGVIVHPERRIVKQLGVDDLRRCFCGFHRHLPSKQKTRVMSEDYETHSFKNHLV